jgi:hypothetical protein
MNPTLTSIGERIKAPSTCPTCHRSLKDRTSGQNKFLWEIYGYISKVSGDTTEDIHEACKQEFLGRHFVYLGGKELEVAKSTKKLSTKEFSEYLERVIQLATGFYNVSLPYKG